jgi:hypothetical protein
LHDRRSSFDLTVDDACKPAEALVKFSGPSPEPCTKQNTRGSRIFLAPDHERSQLNQSGPRNSLRSLYERQGLLRSCHLRCRPILHFPTFTCANPDYGEMDDPSNPSIKQLRIKGIRCDLGHSTSRSPATARHLRPPLGPKSCFMFWVARTPMSWTE